jgi:hypothetical protein
MHDAIGSAGMLRGWTAVWTMQMLWLFASLTIAVGVLALVELLVLEYRRRRLTKVNADNENHCAGRSASLFRRAASFLIGPDVAECTRGGRPNAGDR